MNFSGKPIPALFVKTTQIELPANFQFANYLAPQGSAFIRDGEGMIGSGELIKLTASGPNRIADLASQWRAVVASATVEGNTDGLASGLVAFGSIAFSDHSKTSSTLLVPKAILGFRDGRGWLTTISVGNFAQATDWQHYWPEASIAATSGVVTLQPGQLSEQGFESNVDLALESIKAGTISKVVLARDLQATVDENFDIRAPIKRLLEKYPSCWTYWVDGLFGASPELLVRVTHRRVSARVLAGTAGRGTDPEVDRAIATALTTSAKNTFEHKLAVESLVRTLSPFCTSVVADETPFSLALPNLWHLASDVQGIVSDDSSVLDLASALHPTAAVAGTPRDKAQELITQLEPFDRGAYAGPVGWIGANGDGEWAIALRGASVTGNLLTAFAGCGIVSGSDAHAELAETELKFKPIRQALQ